MPGASASLGSITVPPAAPRMRTTATLLILTHTLFTRTARPCPLTRRLVPTSPAPSTLLHCRHGYFIHSSKAQWSWTSTSSFLRVQSPYRTPCLQWQLTASRLLSVRDSISQHAPLSSRCPPAQWSSAASSTTPSARLRCCLRVRCSTCPCHTRFLHCFPAIRPSCSTRHTISRTITTTHHTWPRPHTSCPSRHNSQDHHYRGLRMR